MPEGSVEIGGLGKGDVMIGFDRKEINAAGDLTHVVNKTPIRKKIEVNV